MLGGLYLGEYYPLSGPTYDPAVENNRLFVDVGGSSIILQDSLSISQNAGQGNATFQVPVGGVRPAPFSAVRIGLGSLIGRDLIFKGKEQETTQYRKELPTNTWWDGSAVDSSAEFNRMIVYATYTNVPIELAAADLLSKYAPDFTGANIATGLGNITIVFSGTTLDLAFNAFARAIVNGHYYRDEAYDVHLFSGSEALFIPDPLDSSNTTLLTDPPLKWKANTRNVRNSVIGIGANTTLLSALSLGETKIPVQDASIFDDAPNTVLVGAQRLTYTNRSQSIGGSLVGPGIQPSTALVPAPIAGTGMGIGGFNYAYTFVTAAGETKISPASFAITYDVSTPTAPIDAGDPVPEFSNSNIGIAGETVSYKVTFGTAASAADFAHDSPASSVMTTVLTASSFAPGFTKGKSVTLTYSSDPAVKWIRLWASAPSVRSGAYCLAPIIVDHAQIPVPGISSNCIPNIPGGGTITIDDGYERRISPALPTGSANYNQVAITGIAIGPAGVTARKVYRTPSFGAPIFKLQQTIANNTSTVGVNDSTFDPSLGAAAPLTDTSGLTQPTGQVIAGSTELPLAGAGAFDPTGGWAYTGTTAIRYTGITGNELTGIPASGLGSIAITLPYNTQILAVSMLTGVPASGPGSLLTPAPSNALVSLYTERNDVLCQAAVAALEGGTSTGKYQFKIDDSTQITQASLNARCDADLLQYSTVNGIIEVTYDTYDKKSHYGRTVHVDRPADGLVGDFFIQTVNIKAIGRSPNMPPIYSVTASSIRFSFEDFMRRAVLSSQ